jgi:hypothetical protein
VLDVGLQQCHSKFKHSVIEETGILGLEIPRKPDFPVGGSSFTCLKCGLEATYQRYELTVQDWRQ